MSRRDSRANAERIVDAIQRLWADDATPSMDQIAAEAGVGIATVYRHFPNRAALESAAFGRIFADELMPLVEDTEDEDADLLDVAARFVEVVSRYTPVLGEVGVSQVTDEALDDLAEPFVELLRRGQERGVLRHDLEPLDIYWLLRMVVLGLNSPVSSESVRRRYLAMLLQALSPEVEGPLPSLTEQDYDRLNSPESRRRPPIARD
ncbi:TetR/AcrR family transcriptional regulator [Aeromicrobium duanguangcaii]|uniref:TetR/AcrR family transcriptional regulator n=1 Tax=Aeromicrobium duanguangcaii TaxID=2968086 RepID=A0ABY5KEK3_9ACTN|nr:TetR/AcrR family transcriptional regulator [Aeromicrobium duanguangcaii]MCD9154042.1 TetR/AcrR family transcriptional regulator [Aeromicrobium duanguangcaii]MCL3837777.1 TetR/AcrR family transcriptional regulator [Aeromicrobium duanguangcaii]UUI68881.1 TetR/AcrR family transcriptional regulator [Aeromicrobium duanguangcaii]